MSSRAGQNGFTDRIRPTVRSLETLNTDEQRFHFVMQPKKIVPALEQRKNVEIDDNMRCSKQSSDRRDNKSTENAVTDESSALGQ